MKKCLILLNGKFPYGNAITSRFLSFCKLFKMSGYEVHLIAAYSDKEQYGVETDCCSFDTPCKKSPTSLASFVGNPAFVRYAVRYIKSNNPDLVFSNGFPNFFSIARITRKMNIPYYVEQCEMLDVSSFKFGYVDFRFIRNYYLQQCGGYKKASGIISISRLIDEHYKKMGIPSCRIPTILDVDNTEYRIKADENRKKTVLIYTGNPSKSKELFGPVINAIKNNETLRDKVEFHIYGPKKERVLSELENGEEVLDSLKNSVFIHGYVQQEKMSEIIRDADYQIFLRPQRRSSDAGFPTKFGESETVGTPIITNITGDIGLYLRDGENGFVLPDISEDSVREVLLKAVGLSVQSKENMRAEARKTAEESFNYKKYKDELGKLISETGRNEK